MTDHGLSIASASKYLLSFIRSMALWMAANPVALSVGLSEEGGEVMTGQS